MSKNNEIRSAGLKVTHARKRILEVLETSKKSHLSADDINKILIKNKDEVCLLYTSPSPRDVEESRMPSSA